MFILGLLPDIVPFDPAAGITPALEDRVLGAAAALTAVTLVVGAGARASTWAADAAIGLARAWPAGRRVLLADLDLDTPVLHERLGIANDEGLVDVIDFGVSPSRVIQPVAGGRWDLLPAGLFAAFPEETLRDSGWDRLLADVAARRGTLLAWLPADAPGADAMIERAGAVIVLAEADEADAVVASMRRPYAILAVLTSPRPPDTSMLRPPEMERTEPAGGARMSNAEFDRIRLPTDRPTRDSLILELRERQRAALMAAPEATPATPPTQASPAAPPHDAQPAPTQDAPAAPLPIAPTGGDAGMEMRLEAAADDVAHDTDTAPETFDPAHAPAPPARARRYSHPLWWTIGIVVIVSALASAWHFLSESNAAERAAAEAAAAPTAAPAVPVTPPVVRDVPLGYAVALEAHRELDVATGRVGTLAEAAPTLRFHVAPLEREGALFYHVMAGPVTDSMAALTLRDTLVSRGFKTAVTPGDVRHSPLAFVIGDYGSRELADAQLAELLRLDVPGYTITGTAADGAPLHRVYVGGFASEVEADVMRQLLRSAGVKDSLVTRTGNIAQ